MWHSPNNLINFAVAILFLNAHSGLAQQNNEAKFFLVGPTQIAVSKPIVISNDGVTDSVGKFFPWPILVDAQQLGEQSDEFQQMRQLVGEPLFRIDRRLRMGEWSGLEQLANGLTTKEFSEASGNLARIKLAALHGCLHSHRYEAAASNLINLHGVPKLEEVVKEYPKLITSPNDLQTGFCENLLPLFFDRITARDILAKNKLIWLRQLPERQWGSHLYVVGLLLAAEEFQEAQVVINTWDDAAAELREWKLVFNAQIEIANEQFGEKSIVLERQLPKLHGLAKLCGQYGLAEAYAVRAKTESQSRQALLRLLEVVAINQRHYDQLAECALSRAIALANDRGWEFERDRLKSELLKNHPDTYHGRLLLKERDD